jgi:hypothetical protein
MTLGNGSTLAMGSQRREHVQEGSHGTGSQSGEGPLALSHLSPELTQGPKELL